MEELNILDLIKYLKKNVVVIIIITLLFIIAGAVYTLYFQIPKYKSQTTLLLLKANENIDPSYTQSDILMNEKLVTTYSEIIKSKKVLNRVINELNLKISTAELTKMIYVSSPKESILIAISVTSISSKEATEIANATATVFSQEIQNLLNMQNVGIVDEAVETTDAYNVSPIKQIVLPAIAGVLLAIFVLFILYYFDTTVKNEEQIEKAIGLPVIGIIPIKKRGAKWKKN